MFPQRKRAPEVKRIPWIRFRIRVWSVLDSLDLQSHDNTHQVTPSYSCLFVFTRRQKTRHRWRIYLLHKHVLKRLRCDYETFLRDVYDYTMRHLYSALYLQQLEALSNKRWMDRLFLVIGHTIRYHCNELSLAHWPLYDILLEMQNVSRYTTMKLRPGQLYNFLT